MAQAFSRWPLTAEAWFQSQVSVYEIWVWGNGTRTGSSPSPSISPGTVIPPMLHIHSIPCYIILASGSVVK